VQSNGRVGLRQRMLKPTLLAVAITYGYVVDINILYYIWG
jgi:hypothetical protein